MSRSSRLFSALLLLPALFCVPARPDTATPSRTDWQAFRKAYPYHIQGVAVSEPANGRQTLIVAEPPPGVTIDALRQVDAEAFESPVLMRHRIGYDGWVKDVVVSLPVRTPAQLQELTDRLHIYLFGTAYKSNLIHIANSSSPRKAKLNLRVSAADLNKWLFVTNERFQLSGAAGMATLSEVLNRGRSGVYYSESPGLVALVVSRRSQLSAMSRQLRQFALDSDLILGATASSTRVAIVARERMEPLDLLPPLRTETILLLANTKNSKLSQSYERRNLFAGKVDEINADWAPIYLSDDLIDTEYGSLLNITDQMLKSWSSDGMVRYTNFNYEDPQTWPFAKPIIIDAGLKEVTFNWNTKGAGYTMDVNARRILALNRTGSLPVSYIPGEFDETGKNPLQRYEETAYRYFSNTQDPNLVRVVQYAALYQIFREYGIHDDSQPPVHYDHPEWTVLSNTAENLITDLLTNNSRLLQARTDDSPSLVALKQKSRIEAAALKREIDSASQKYGPQLLSDIALRIANPRIDEGLREAVLEGTRTYASLSLAEARGLVADRIASDFQKTEMAQAYASSIGGSNRIALYRTYAEQAGLRTSVWIHTPSVVISRTQGQMADMVGGHNLDSKVVRFRVSETVPKGTTRVIEERGSRIVLVSAQDAEKVPQLLRTAALTSNPLDLPASLQPILSRPVEVASNLPRSTVLAFENPNPAVRGLSAAQVHAPVLGGWSSEARSFSAPNPAQTFAKLGTRSIRVEKYPDFSFAVYSSDSTVTIKASSYDAAVDAVVTAMKNPDGPAGAWNLDLRGFEGPEAKNFVRTAEVYFSAKEKLQVAGFASRDGFESNRVLGAFSEHYDFRNAKIIEAVPEEAAFVDGEMLHAVNVKVEIPSITPAKPTLIMRIRIFFSERITGPVLEAVQRAVDAVLIKAQLRRPVLAREGMSQDAIAAHIFAGIKDDLKKVSVPGARQVDFEIHLDGDFGDFLVAEQARYANEYAG